MEIRLEPAQIVGSLSFASLVQSILSIVVVVVAVKDAFGNNLYAFSTLLCDRLPI